MLYNYLYYLYNLGCVSHYLIIDNKYTVLFCVFIFKFVFIHFRAGSWFHNFNLRIFINSLSRNFSFILMILFYIYNVSLYSDLLYIYIVLLFYVK